MKFSKPFLLVIFILFSISSKYGYSQQIISNTELLAKSKDFLDVDLRYFTDPAYTEKADGIPKEESRKIKAVIYRVYSHVELKNNHYILKINKGSDINISENLFHIYKNNLNLLNQKANAKQPAVIKLPPITKEYLDSLIKD